MAQRHQPDAPALEVEPNYLGYGKNSDGVLGLCGQLTVSRHDGAELKGHLESSNPLLFLSPKRLSGEKTIVTYWMPPVAFPQPDGQLVIRDRHDTHSVAIASLFPKSRTDYWSEPAVILALLAPSALSFVYFAFVFWYLGSHLTSRVRELFPEQYQSALQGLEPSGFLSRSFGLYQLEVVPAAESLQLIWAAIIFLAPLLCTKLFRHFSTARRRRYGGLLAVGQLLPSVGLLGLWNSEYNLFPLFAHPDFEPLSLGRLAGWGVPLNAVIACYLFLSAYGVWDRLIKTRELRTALPVLLWAAYALTVFVMIFGRSWTA